jgi:hypothetical protein
MRTVAVSFRSPLVIEGPSQTYPTSDVEYCKRYAEVEHQDNTRNAGTEYKPLSRSSSVALGTVAVLSRRLLNVLCMRVSDVETRFLGSRHRGRRKLGHYPTTAVTSHDGGRSPPKT